MYGAGAGNERRLDGAHQRAEAPTCAAPEREVTGLAELRERADSILAEVEKAVVGKRGPLELILLALLSDGHVLLEDYPGLAKTLIARSFAQATSLRFARIQFTPT